MAAAPGNIPESTDNREWDFVKNSDGKKDDESSEASSCEFVNVCGEGILYCRGSDSKPGICEVVSQPSPSIVTVADTEHQSSHDGEQDAALAEIQDGGEGVDKNCELRKLLHRLEEERNQSGSPVPCSSGSSSDFSDFVQLASPGDADSGGELMTSSSGSRFSIVLRGDADGRGQLQSSSRESSSHRQHIAIDPVENIPAPPTFGEDEESEPDADDRVESDILAANVLPAAMPEVDDVGHVAPTVRQYTHRPNPDLNMWLTVTAIAALCFAIGIGLGHNIGTSREANLQQLVQEGQKLRLQALQDDLLMCLRKQEDIDQTINKLNEIEDILVDAEHWRKEYEELLNIKLLAEEAWRSEKTGLIKSNDQLKLSRNSLMAQKACAHDNEFLSRQETTLNSVHDKLEASLKEKDLQVADLQRQVVEYKINLTAAENMWSVYKKAVEDKTLVNLDLKEQLLDSERQLFDHLHERSASQHMETTPTSEMKERTTLEGSSVEPAMDTESKSQVSEGETTPTTSQEDYDTLSKEYDKLLQQYHELEAEVMTLRPTVSSVNQQLFTCQSESQSLRDGYSSQQLISRRHEDMILQLKKSLNQVKLEKAELLAERLTPQNKEQGHANPVNSTENNLLCRSICGKMANASHLSMQQLSHMYNVTRDHYTTLEHVVTDTWAHFNATESTESLRNTTEYIMKGLNNATEAPIFRKYLNKTQQTVDKIITSVNSSWQDLKNLTTEYMTPDSNSRKTVHNLKKNIHTKISKMSEKLDATLSMVRTHVMGALFPKESEKHNFHQPMEMDPQDKPSPKMQEQPKDRHKSKTQTFNSHVDRLRLDLAKMHPKTGMSSWTWHEVKYIYERFDDMDDDVEDMKGVEKETKVWISCQKKWWKQIVSRDDFDSPMKISNKCMQTLLPWQLPDELPQISASSEWVFARAEQREFDRDKPDDWYWGKA